jgi:hypothetical protein
MNRLYGMIAGTVLVMAVLPIKAHAELAFLPGNPTVQVLDAAEKPYAISGGHPDRVVVGLSLAPGTGNVKDVEMSMPPGFGGDPSAVPACPRRLFEESVLEEKECEPGARVGTLTIFASGRSFEGGIFNIETAPDQVSELAVPLVGKQVFIGHIGSEGFEFEIRQENLSQTVPVEQTEVELWGVPADHQEATEIPRLPFLTMPGRCDQGPFTVIVRADSWQEPDHWVTASGSTGVPLTGCKTLPFEPQVSFGLETERTDTPTGVDIDLSMPQDEDPDGRWSANVGKVDLALPEGLAISPSAVEGLVTCPDSALHGNSEAAAECPAASKVGTVELMVPQLPGPIRGNVYIGQEATGERFRLFLVPSGFGVSAKLVAALRVDPTSGRIALAMGGLPALSFSRLSLDLNGGVRALLATPLNCGKLTATATLWPFGELPPVQVSDAATLTGSASGGPCPEALPFSPGFSGGTSPAAAASDAALILTLSRPPGDQLLDLLKVALPPGISAAVGGVEECAATAISRSDCPGASRLGSVVGELGSGPDPATLAGDVYLTGPYRGAPMGLALVFPGRVGPFALKSVIVRAALRIDPDSGRLSVETDQLPKIVEGIPLRFRGLELDVDRPGFIRTPTSCAASSVDAVVRASDGRTAATSTPFRVHGCDSLAFAPQVSIGLVGHRLRGGDRPAVDIAIHSHPGEANLRSVDVALPPWLKRSPSSSATICARQDAREGRCPAKSTVGRADARILLSQKPLSGSINLVQPEGKGAPELWTTLRLETTNLFVHSKLAIKNGRLHTLLTELPDVPLRRLRMQLDGGRRGLVTLDSDPCPGRRSKPARVDLEGQNRAYAIRRRPVAIPGCDAGGELRLGAGSGAGRG